MPTSSLTPAEQSFVEATTRGAVWGADYYREWVSQRATVTPLEKRAGGAAPKPVPAMDPPSDQDRPVLRAHIVRSVIDGTLGPDAATENRLPKGIQIAKAHINGVLDLEAVHFDRSLAIVDTQFEHGLILRDAQLRTLTLDRSTVPYVDAASCRIGGHFRARRLAADFIMLLGAEVEGHLVLQGTQLNPARKALNETGGTALQCNAARFGASVFLRQGFVACGMVSFVRTRIAGQLACVGGHFHNPKGLALNCNAVDIGVDAFLDDGFTAKGEVNFAAARIGGQLSCFGGTFENPDGVAFDLDGADIGADAFLRDGFTARGMVNFARSRIGGSLQLRADSHIEGDVDLRQARAAVLMDEPDCWPPAPHAINLDGFIYDRFGDGAPVSWRVRLPWLRRGRQADGRAVFRPQPWNQAAKVLEAMGHDHDANVIRQKREKHRPLAAPAVLWLPARLGKLLFALTTGHGYRPGLTVLWSLAVILAGGLVFSHAQQTGQMVPSGRAALAESSAADGSGQLPGADYEPLKPWAYSVDLFLPLIDLGQVKYWMPRDPRGNESAAQIQEAAVEMDLTFGDIPETLSSASGPEADQPLPAGTWLPKAWFWIQSILGWILTPLAILGFAGIRPHRNEDRL